MAAKDLKARNRTEVTLSDGITKVMVRRLQPFDFLSTGTIPDILFDGSADEEKRKATLADRKVLMAMYKVAFLRGVRPTDDFVPVDKEQTEDSTNEVCLADLTEGDLSAILNAAIQGGAGAPASFPADKEGAAKS